MVCSQLSNRHRQIQTTGLGYKVIIAMLDASTRRLDLFMTIVNVYAPTSKAGLDVKNQFCDDLQRTLDSVPERWVLMAR